MLPWKVMHINSCSLSDQELRLEGYRDLTSLHEHSMCSRLRTGSQGKGQRALDGILQYWSQTNCLVDLYPMGMWTESLMFCSGDLHDEMLHPNRFRKGRMRRLCIDKCTYMSMLKTGSLIYFLFYCCLYIYTNRW